MNQTSTLKIKKLTYKNSGRHFYFDLILLSLSVSLPKTFQTFGTKKKKSLRSTFRLYFWFLDRLTNKQFFLIFNWWHGLRISVTIASFGCPQLSVREKQPLKAHRQISKKWCFQKHCSCDKACQFLASYGTPWRSYLTTDDKLMNKRFRLFVHETMCLSKACWEEKTIRTS